VRVAQVMEADRWQPGIPGVAAEHAGELLRVDELAVLASEYEIAVTVSRRPASRSRARSGAPNRPRPPAQAVVASCSAGAAPPRLATTWSQLRGTYSRPSSAKASLAPCSNASAPAASGAPGSAPSIKSQ
jgi:hypothetical protein